jgi:hypothetical protein
MGGFSVMSAFKGEAVIPEIKTAAANSRPVFANFEKYLLTYNMDSLFRIFDLKSARIINM